MPEADNVLADVLLRIYSNDSASDARVHSEYTYHDVVDDDIDVLPGGIDRMSEVEAAAIGLHKWKDPIVPAETGRP